MYRRGREGGKEQLWRRVAEGERGMRRVDEEGGWDERQLYKN